MDRVWFSYTWKLTGFHLKGYVIDIWIGGRIFSHVCKMIMIKKYSVWGFAYGQCARFGQNLLTSVDSWVLTRILWVKCDLEVWQMTLKLRVCNNLRYNKFGTNLMKHIHQGCSQAVLQTAHVCPCPDFIDNNLITVKKNHCCFMTYRLSPNFSKIY